MLHSFYVMCKRWKAIMSRNVSFILVLFNLSSLHLNIRCLSKWPYEYLSIEGTRSSNLNPFPTVQTNFLRSRIHIANYFSKAVDIIRSLLLVMLKAIVCVPFQSTPIISVKNTGFHLYYVTLTCNIKKYVYSWNLNLNIYLKLTYCMLF